MQWKAAWLIAALLGLPLSAHGQMVNSQIEKATETEAFMDGAPVDVVTCGVDLAMGSDIIAPAYANAQKTFITDGDQMRMLIEGSDPELEVIVQYSRKQNETTGEIEKNLQIKVLKTLDQKVMEELKTGVKHLMYTTDLPKDFFFHTSKDYGNLKLNVSTLIVECSN